MICKEAVPNTDSKWGLVFEDKVALTRHKIRDHHIEVIFCRRCHMSFALIGSLATHKSRVPSHVNRRAMKREPRWKNCSRNRKKRANQMPTLRKEKTKDREGRLRLRTVPNLSESEVEGSDDEGSDNEGSGNDDDKGTTSSPPQAQPIPSPPLESQENEQEGSSEGSDDEGSKIPPSPLPQNHSSPNPSSQSQQSEGEDENKRRRRRRQK